MKSIVLIFSLIIGFNIVAQWNNKVPNYSFEKVDFWPPTDANGWNSPNQLANNNLGITWNEYDNIALYWEPILDWTHPLYGCLFKGFVPTADVKKYIFPLPINPQTQQPTRSNGDYYGYTSGEYLVVPIEGCFNGGANCITSDKSYYIEFFFDGVGAKKVWLNNQQPKFCNVTNNIDLDQLIVDEIGSSHLSVNPTQFYGWKRYRGYFTPSDNNKKWLTFGTAGHWDDIKIYELNHDLCRNEWYFDNTVFNYPLEIFQAGDFIKAGTGVDPEVGQLDGPVTVLSTSHTIFRAGNTIYLEPGFEVDSLNGAIFEAVIEPCKNLCPTGLPLLASYTCVDAPIQIGSDSYDGTYVNVNWTPTTYLDNPNSGNPIFTPPSGGAGEITYTAHLSSSTCPVSSSVSSVTVNYGPNSNVNPSISYSNLVYDDYSM